MNVYLSGSFAAREAIRDYACQVETLGHTVTSNWLYEPPLRTDEDHREWEYRARANEDLADIRRSDLVAVFTEWPSTTGGRHAELVAGVIWEKQVCTVGPLHSDTHHEPVFAYLAAVRHFEAFDDFRDWLAEE